MSYHGAANDSYVRCYGCVRCQHYHYEGDPLFSAHKMFQSKHGMTTRSLAVAKADRERRKAKQP